MKDYSVGRKKVNTKEELADLLSYNPDTGEIYYINNNKKAGWNKEGYIRIGKLQVYGHHIAFYKMLGRWPTEIDHKNKNRSDNSWGNLREVSHKDNCKNVPGRDCNQTGVQNVHKNRKGYDIRIGKVFRAFNTNFEKACELAKNKRKELYGEFS